MANHVINKYQVKRYLHVVACTFKLALLDSHVAAYYLGSVAPFVGLQILYLAPLIVMCNLIELFGLVSACVERLTLTLIYLTLNLVTMFGWIIILFPHYWWTVYFGSVIITLMYATSLARHKHFRANMPDKRTVLYLNGKLVKVEGHVPEGVVKQVTFVSPPNDVEVIDITPCSSRY